MTIPTFPIENADTLTEEQLLAYVPAAQQQIDRDGIPSITLWTDSNGAVCCTKHAGNALAAAVAADPERIVHQTDIDTYQQWPLVLAVITGLHCESCPT